MSSSTAQGYLEHFGDDREARLALLACSAALRLDDDTAHAAIELVAQSNGSTDGLLRRVKGLGCVWREWDGSWYVAEDVRPHLLDRLHDEVPEATLSSLRERLAADADARASLLPPDGQVTSHDKLLSKFEAAYQRVLIPEKSGEGAAQLAELWQHSSPAAARATANSVDYLADELDRRLSRLPDELIFLRGMAARSRRDRASEEKYFRQVWERGGYGYIYAVAAHLFGLLIQRRDRETAERALVDSIRWYASPFHRTRVYHSLGNLLAKDRQRWEEAEKAYNQSIDLDENDSSRAETLHSFGNLLAKIPGRVDEAEQVYKQSLDLDKDSRSRSETLHSLGKLLFKFPRRRREADAALEQSFTLDDTPKGKAQVLATWAAALAELNETESDKRAEEYAVKGIELDPHNPRTSGICYRVLAGVYERRRDYPKAIEAAEGWKKTEETLGAWNFAERTQSKIDELKRKMQQEGESRGKKPGKKKWWEFDE
jgi:tetratricopeptide (TPR) repeat protein